jgi:hypothetical protein
LGSSHRSAVRWDGGHAEPGEDSLRILARLLHREDRKLAEEVAARLHETLVSLGLEAPTAPPAAPPPPPPPPPTSAPAIRPEDLVDIVVLTAVEHTGAPIADVRRLLHAVFKRACDVGLTAEAAERGLRTAMQRAHGTRALLAAVEERETAPSEASRSAGADRLSATSQK